MEYMAARMDDVITGGISEREYMMAELATVRADVERLKKCVKVQVADNAVTFGDGWDAALEEAAHLIECDGDALGGKIGAAKAIRGLMSKEALK